MVKEAWDNDVRGTPMYILTRKLKRVKAILRDFNLFIQKKKKKKKRDFFFFFFFLD